jgi:hypothetical protein
VKRLFCVLAFILSSSSAFAQGSSGTYNFRFSPIGLIIGAVSADLDVAINDQWTLGPEFSYWHLSFDQTSGLSSKLDLTALSLGARANWFKNGIYTDGLYVGPSLKYLNARASATDTSGASASAETSTAVAQVLVGYGWFWDSFNMMLGGGASTSLGTTSITVQSSNGQQTSENLPAAGLALEFTLGWTF